MSFNYGRGGGNGEVSIDYERCTACGLCVKVCKGAPLYIENGRLEVDQNRLFGCIACGQCVAVCPHDAISVTGRDLYPEDVVPIPAPGIRASYEQLEALMFARRATRDFTDSDVEPELIVKILAAVSTAPMGIPPTEVGALVLAGREKVKAFRNDLLAQIKGWQWMFSPVSLALMRPFMSKADYTGMRDFVAPALETYIKTDREGLDWFFYDAPLAMFFHANGLADAADPYIASTYAMLAGQALGLGTCMLGFPAYILQYSRKVREKYGLPRKLQPGVMVIFGYPAVHYRKAIKRRLAKV